MENQINDLYAYFVKNPVVCTDTRNISPGCIFFALKGEHFNGNSFAAKALELGASLAVIDEPGYNQGKGYFLVNNVLNALQGLAHVHRKTLKIPFIAITGSNGKTTTKELVSAVLSSEYKVLCTKGNLNNHIGVPLTILLVNDAHQFAVVEMGANHQKEIELLCKIASPGFGLITNIGKAHLEGFGGIEGVKKGKGELYEYLKKNNGLIFFNPDQQPLLELLDNYPNFLSYGSDKNYEISGHSQNDGTFLTVRWSKKGVPGENEIRTRLTGTYNLTNVLAAVCVGNYFQVSPEKICASIAAYEPGNQRSQVIHKGSNTIVLDAYNANPSSMEEALKNFNYNYKGPKMVVLGDMLELGKESEKEHAHIIDLIEQMNFDEVVLVGNHFFSSDRKTKGNYFNNSEDAKTWINSRKISNTSVLIKGSRGLQMEKTLEAFMPDDTADVKPFMQIG